MWSLISLYVEIFWKVLPFLSFEASVETKIPKNLHWIIAEWSRFMYVNIIIYRLNSPGECMVWKSSYHLNQADTQFHPLRQDHPADWTTCFMERYNIHPSQKHDWDKIHGFHACHLCFHLSIDRIPPHSAKSPVTSYFFFYLKLLYTIVTVSAFSFLSPPSPPMWSTKTAEFSVLLTLFSYQD